MPYLIVEAKFSYGILINHSLNLFYIFIFQLILLYTKLFSLSLIRSIYVSYINYWIFLVTIYKFI